MRSSDWSSDVCSSDRRVVNRRDLLLNGKALGITSLIVWVKGSNTPRQYIVRVQLPKDPLKASVPDPELRNAVVDPGRGVEGKLDGKSVVEGKSVSVRVDLGGRSIIKKKKQKRIEERN